MLLEIATPFGRIPDFQPVKHAHDHDFQVVFQRDDFSQPSGNEDSAGLVDFRRRGFSHDEVHEEPALIFIERVFDACEDFFPFLNRVGCQRKVLPLDENYAVSLRFHLLAQGSRDQEATPFHRVYSDIVRQTCCSSFAENLSVDPDAGTSLRCLG